MSFRYLASPYSSDNPGEQVYRYYEAMKCLHWLLKQHIYTYSPIVHCHPMAEKFKLPSNSIFWRKYNRQMIDSSIGILVLKISGWNESVGVIDEIDYALDREREIDYISPIKDGYTIERILNPGSE